MAWLAERRLGTQVELAHCLATENQMGRRGLARQGLGRR
jgi:hypothetical protein